MINRTVFPAILVGFAACVGCREEVAIEQPIPSVLVRKAEPYAGTDTVRYTGAIEPNLRVDVAFKYGGYVETLMQVPAGGRSRPVQDGDTVSRGAVLATLRAADFTEKRNQAQSQLRQAQVSLDYATTEFARAERLFNEKSLTKADLDGAKAKLDVARAQVDGARALAKEADNGVGDSALRSPIDGIVLKRLVEIGAMAGPGIPAFVLADTRQVKVVFGAPDTIVRTLRVGAPQMITSAAEPDVPLRGTITRVAPAADPRSRIFDVEVTIPNENGRLRPGMVAALEIGASEPTAAPVVVPLSAITRSRKDRNGYAVVVVEDRGGRQIAQSRDVALGDTLGNAIAVTSGLKTGERVVVSGATLVTDGDPVRIANP